MSNSKKQRKTVFSGFDVGNKARQIVKQFLLDIGDVFKDIEKDTRAEKFDSSKEVRRYVKVDDHEYDVETILSLKRKMSDDCIDLISYLAAGNSVNPSKQLGYLRDQEISERRLKQTQAIEKIDELNALSCLLCSIFPKSMHRFMHWSTELSELKVKARNWKNYIPPSSSEKNEEERVISIIRPLVRSKKLDLDLDLSDYDVSKYIYNSVMGTIDLLKEKSKKNIAEAN